MQATINQEIQLLVEGRSTQVFIAALLQHLKFSEIEVHNFGGLKDLPRFLRTFAASPGFRQRVRSLGIIRDAEVQGSGPARQSVHDILRSADLPLPGQTGVPCTSVYILPDDNRPGMLETLCLMSVQTDPAMHCVESYLECLATQQLSIINLEKAKVQAFLASRPKFVAHVGEAANKGYWPWENTAFSALKKFLEELVRR